MTDEAKRLSDDPEVIFLAPECIEAPNEGRTWAEDCPWDDCDCSKEHPHKPIKYIRADRLSASTERHTQMTEERAREILSKANKGVPIIEKSTGEIWIRKDVAIAAILAPQPGGVSAEAAAIAMREAHIKVLSYWRDRLAEYHTPKYETADKTSIGYIAWFIDHTIECAAHLEISKLGRWTGFIQAGLAHHGYLNVDEERERTRPIFALPIQQFAMKENENG